MYVCVVFARIPYLLSRYRARFVSSAHDSSSNGGRQEGEGVEGQIGVREGEDTCPPPSLLPPQVHLVHLRDGGGIIRPERCIMHARGTARGIQVKETSPWKRPWPPSINTRDGVSVRSFVRSFVRSAGRSLTQAKSPRGPIGHVRERSSLYPSTSPPCPPAPAPPTPPPSSLSLTWRSRYNSSPPSQARMVFSFDVFPFADVLAFGVTDANRDERDVPCQLSRYVGTCESHVERKGRGKDSPFRIYFGSLSNQTRVKRII